MEYQRLAKILPLKNIKLEHDNVSKLKVRLSNHATFASLQIDINNIPILSWEEIFLTVSNIPEYHFIHLNHNSFPLKGSHGPYSVHNLKSNSFNMINKKFFMSSIIDILKKNHWLQPPVDNGKFKILKHRALDLSNAAISIYMLDKSLHIPKKPYDNEWSHAFIEFYEFFIVTADNIFIWTLIYE